jgi:hypothetical protein
MHDLRVLDPVGGEDRHPLPDDAIGHVGLRLAVARTGDGIGHGRSSRVPGGVARG